ncbi:MAG: hypothetical protein QNK11_06540 [Legionella sp.]|nr:hypothetical protein [Legionella sp.]
MNKWKFRISIAPAYLNDIWLLIEPILLSDKSSMFGFDVVNITQENVPQNNQIVLYEFNNANGTPLTPPEAIFNLLVKLESTLRYYKIPAGTHLNPSEKIPGSRYISIRHDFNFEKVECNPYAHFSFSNPNNNKQRFFTQKRGLSSRLNWIEHEAHKTSNDLEHFSLAFKKLCDKTTCHFFNTTYFEAQLGTLLSQYPETTEIILSPKVTGVYLKPEYLLILVRALSNYSNIYMLNLSDYGDKPIGDDVIESIKQNMHLEHVDLSNNYTSDQLLSNNTPSSVMVPPETAEMMSPVEFKLDGAPPKHWGFVPIATTNERDYSSPPPPPSM